MGPALAKKPFRRMRSAAAPSFVPGSGAENASHVLLTCLARLAAEEEYSRWVWASSGRPAAAILPPAWSAGPPPPGDRTCFQAAAASVAGRAGTNCSLECLLSLVDGVGPQGS